MANPKDDVFYVGSWQGSTPRWVMSSANWWGYFYDPVKLQSKAYMYNHEWESYHWRRNYNGIFSAHIMDYAPENQKILFAVSHGENKNEKVGGYFYQNTIRTDFRVDVNNSKTYSGGNPYTDCWEAYFGFLNGNWISYNQQNNWGNAYFNDIGPIAWPSAGYLYEDGTQASKGLRHPSSIVAGNHLYIFVMDESLDNLGGVKLIRAHVDNILEPNMYETWSLNGWIPALPEGFKKEEAASFFKHRGPKNSPLFSPKNNTIRFSVARLKGTDQFIGVEEFIIGGGDNTIKVAFRFSDDLIHWSDRQVFYSKDNWSSSNLRYPIFLNRDGTSNTEIDLEEFYVLGSTADGTVTKLHFKQNSSIYPTNGVRQKKELNNFIPSSLQLTVSPVPASLTIDIKFELKAKAEVEMNLYNSKGLKVATLLHDTLEPQVIVKTVDIAGMAPGVYFIELIGNKNRVQKKFLKI